PNQRGELCEVLGRLANPHAAVPLLDVVEREENFQLRQAAAEALITTLEPEHLPRLKKLVSRSQGSSVSGYLWRAWVQADRRQGFELTRALFRSDEKLALQAVYTARSSAHPSDE